MVDLSDILALLGFIEKLIVVISKNMKLYTYIITLNTSYVLKLIKTLFNLLD